MSLNSINPRKGYATDASLDLNVYLEFEEFAGETYFQLCMDSESPNVNDMHVVRDLLTDFIDSQAPKLALVPTEPSESVCVSREIVAGVEVSEYVGQEGRMIALETDETVPASELPELAHFLLSIYEDDRLADARAYFDSEDAIDPNDFTIKTLADFAVANGFDGSAFLKVAAEVMGR